MPTRVAVLDDDSSVRRALARLLKTEGMLVGSYATSDELFDALALETPDFLILDLQMPKMDGLDVLRHLRRLALCVPTIILTAHEEAGSREACLREGAVEYLRKPLNAELLLRTIGRLLA